MNTADLDFHLPLELIAQEPAPDRPAARLLHYRKSDRSIAHRSFADLPTLLRPGDLLVFNNARVVPARFMLIKPTGGRVEGLFLEQRHPRRWNVLLKNVGPWTPETIYIFESHSEAMPTDEKNKPVQARIVVKGVEGQFTIEVDTDESASALLERLGRMPLPPYIKREKGRDARDPFDRLRYQTVYAQTPGSIAAPTAGLHFDEQVLRDLEARGIERAFVTLHVGLGTFKPVTTDTLERHIMHVETYSVDSVCAEQLNRAKRDARRIVCVGTTSARVIESQPADQPFAPLTGQTDIFIYPPYSWRHIGALLTNFHLPRSTLIALVAAWVGLDEQRRIYAEAIANRYRFFSYGDSSFLE